MYEPVRTSRFKSDVKKYTRQKEKAAIKKALSALIRGNPVASMQDHKLRGPYENYRECHVRPDLLLIYKIDEQARRIYFVRIGSHSELFS